MNVVVKNPEIIFVADLTRADAPALVVTTQCELTIKNEPSEQSMTAAVSDLKVVACPFLREKRENNVTTVLQPCQVFFQSNQSPTQPQTIELSISSLTLKVILRFNLLFRQGCGIAVYFICKNVISHNRDYSHI